MSHLYIIRGLPGSGKSTLGKDMEMSGLVDDHFEADMWMVGRDGEYQFNPENLGYCHQSCFDAACKSLLMGYHVAVSNTFTTEYEMYNYIKFCQDNNIPFTTIIVENRHGNSSVHNVPEKTMNNMRSRFSIKI